MRFSEWPAPGRLSGPRRGDSVARYRATEWPALGRLSGPLQGRYTESTFSHYGHAVPLNQTFLEMEGRLGGLVVGGRCGNVGLWVAGALRGTRPDQHSPPGMKLCCSRVTRPEAGPERGSEPAGGGARPSPRLRPPPSPFVSEVTR